MKRRLTHKTNIAALTTAGVLATVGIGYAAIPGADGQIKGCYATTNGLLGIPYSKGDTRIVDSAEACRSYEQPISWGQVGPKGATGATGPAGATGPKGATGATGPAGATKVVVRSAYVPSGGGTVNCNAGEVATGGGVAADVQSLMYVDQSEPTPNTGVPTGWKGSLSRRINGTPGSGSVYVICASP